MSFVPTIRGYQLYWCKEKVTNFSPFFFFFWKSSIQHYKDKKEKKKKKVYQIILNTDCPTQLHANQSSLFHLPDNKFSNCAMSKQQNKTKKCMYRNFIRWTNFIIILSLHLHHMRICHIKLTDYITCHVHFCTKIKQNKIKISWLKQGKSEETHHQDSSQYSRQGSHYRKSSPKT